MIAPQNPPEVELLHPPLVDALLRAALLGGADGDLAGFSVSLDDLHYRPGAEATGVYTVRYRTAEGEVTDHLLATTADVGEPAVEVSSPEGRLAVWRHPADPRLPSLAAACDPTTVLGWLRQLPDHAGGVDALDVTLLGYRPLRRAVLRYTADGRSWFVKVMSAEKSSVLERRIAPLADAGLTPPVVLRPEPGVLLTPAAPGRSLAQALVDWQFSGAPLPLPGDLVDLLDRLPEAVLTLPRRESWAERLDFHTRTAVQQLPAERDRILALSGRIGAFLEKAPDAPTVAVHGDFYEANIFVGDDGLQVIDVDSCGPGLRADDLACCLAHLAALPSLAPKVYPRVPEVIDTWLIDFERRVDAVDLRARTAAVLVSLIASAGSLAEPRLSAAEGWLASAESLADGATGVEAQKQLGRS